MYKLKPEFEGQNFITVLPNGKPVSLNGKPVTRSIPGTGDSPPTEETIPGITQNQIEKYKDHKRFKNKFERYFTEESKSTSTSKSTSSNSGSTSDKKGSSTKEDSKKSNSGDSKDK